MSYQYKKSSILYQLEQAIKKKVAQKPKTKEQAQKNMQSSLDKRKSQNQNHRQSLQRLPSKHKQPIKINKPENSASLFNNQNIANLQHHLPESKMSDSKKINNRKIDKIFSLVNYALSSADKAIKYINMANFQAQFAVKLFKSDKDNLLNQMRNLTPDDIAQSSSYREDKLKTNVPSIIILQQQNLKLKKQLALLEKQNQRSRYGGHPGDMDVALLMRELQIQKYKQSIYRLRGADFVDKLSSIIQKQIKYENLLRKTNASTNEFQSIFRSLISQRNNLCKDSNDPIEYKKMVQQYEEIKYYLEAKIGHLFTKKEETLLKVLQKHFSMSENQLAQKSSSKKIHSQQHISAEQQKISKIRQEKHQLLKQIQDCKKKLGDISEVAFVKSQLQTYKKEVSKFIKKLKNLYPQVGDNTSQNLSNILDVIQSNLNKNSQQLKALENDCILMQKQMNIIKTQNDITEKELQHKLAQIRQMDRQKIDLIEQIKNKNKQIAKMQKDISIYENQLLTNKQQRQEATKQNLRLMSKIQQLEAGIEQYMLENQHKDDKQENDKQQQQANNLNQQEFNKLIQENQQLLEKLQQQNENLQSLHQNITELKRANSQLRKQCEKEKNGSKKLIENKQAEFQQNLKQEIEKVKQEQRQKYQQILKEQLENADSNYVVQIDGLKGKIQQYEEKNKQLQRDYNDQYQSISELVSDKQKTLILIDKLNESLKQKENIIQEFNKKQLEVLQANKEAEIQQLKQTVTKKQSQMDSFKKKIGELLQLQRKLTEKLQKQKQSRQQLESKLVESAKQIEQLQQQIKQLNDKMDQQEEKIKESRMRRQNKQEQEKEQIKDQLKQIKQQSEQVQIDKQALSKQRQELKQKLKKIQQKQGELSQRQKALASAEEELAYRENGAEEIQKQLQSKQQQLRQLQQKAQQISSQAQEKQKQLQQKQKQVSHKWQEIRAKQQQLEQQQLECNNMKALVEEEQRKLKQLQKQLETKDQQRNIQVESKVSKIEERQKQLEQMMAGQNKKINQLQWQESLLSSKLKQFETRHQQFQEKSSKLEEERKMLDQLKESLEAQQADIQSKLSQLESRQTQLQSKQQELLTLELSLKEKEKQHEQKKCLKQKNEDIRETEINQLKEKLTDFLNRQAMLSQRCDKLNKELNVKSGQLDQALIAQNGLLQQVKLKTQLISQFQAQFQTIDNDIKSKDQQINELQNKIEQLTQQNSTLIQNHNQIVQQFQKLKQAQCIQGNNDNENGQQFDENERQKSQYLSKLLQNIQVMEQRIQEYQAKDTEKQQQQQNLTITLESVQQELEQSKKQLEQTNQKYIALVNKLQQTLIKLDQALDQKQSTDQTNAALKKKINQLSESNKSLNHWKNVQIMLEKQYCNLIKRILRAIIDLEEIGDVDNMSVRTLLEVGAQKVIQFRMKVRDQESNEKKMRKHSQQQQEYGYAEDQKYLLLADAQSQLVETEQSQVVPFNVNSQSSIREKIKDTDNPKNTIEIQIEQGISPVYKKPTVQNQMEESSPPNNQDQPKSLQEFDNFEVGVNDSLISEDGPESQLNIPQKIQQENILQKQQEGKIPHYPIQEKFIEKQEQNHQKQQEKIDSKTQVQNQEEQMQKNNEGTDQQLAAQKNEQDQMHQMDDFNDYKSEKMNQSMVSNNQDQQQKKIENQQKKYKKQDSGLGFDEFKDNNFSQLDSSLISQTAIKDTEQKEQQIKKEQNKITQPEKITQQPSQNMKLQIVQKNQIPIEKKVQNKNQTKLLSPQLKEQKKQFDLDNFEKMSFGMDISHISKQFMQPPSNQNNSLDFDNFLDFQNTGLNQSMMSQKQQKKIQQKVQKQNNFDDFNDFQQKMNESMLSQKQIQAGRQQQKSVEKAHNIEQKKKQQNDFDDFGEFNSQKLSESMISQRQQKPKNKQNSNQNKNADFDDFDEFKSDKMNDSMMSDPGAQ